MTPQLVRFESKPRRYALPPEAQPFTVQADGLVVTESFNLDEAPREPTGVGDYRVVAEASVQYREDLPEVASKVIQIADDLDRSWIYATGQRLLAGTWRLQALDDPEGWTSNAAAVQELLPWRGPLHLTATLTGGGAWTQMPHMPLERAWSVRAARGAASDVIKTLIELHYEALQHPSTQAGLFLFAKALEIARELLPGKRDHQRQAALPAEVKAAMRCSLGWLFDMANNRVDIRHAVRDRRTLELHPPLTRRERTDFTHDADLVLRSVVCMEFSLEPTIMKLTR